MSTPGINHSPVVLTDTVLVLSFLYICPPITMYLQFLSRPVRPIVAGTVRLFLPGLLLLATPAIAQNSSGRWMVSLRSGINSYITDFNENKIGFGVEGRGLYGISRNVSLGALIGYEEMKTYLNPNTLGLPYDYVKLHAYPVAAIGTYQGLPGNKVAPYFSVGVGLLLYQRFDWKKDGLPDDGLNTSILIPISVGAEIYLKKDITISAEIGYRVLDDKTETVENSGFDSYATAKVGVAMFFGRSSEDDEDLDGLTEAQEREYGTDPRVVDTDGDGLRDGDEIHRYRSDPLMADTDADGVTDHEEILQWKTDPRKGDTDEDGLTDNVEKGLGTSPLNIDTDGDVLTDGEELTAGSDPLTIDTDADGISDYQELRTHHTGVTVADTDADSVSDGDEVNTTNTDPLKADTDGGGALDGQEIFHGANPLDASDDAALSSLSVATGLQKPVYVYGMNFTRSGAIGKGSETALENAFISIELMDKVDLDVISHTDNTGSEKENERISLLQARSVVAWLVARGIDEKRLRPIGMGGREPIAPNENQTGRAANRRIELRVRR